MTALHETLTGADVDVLRLPLKKKLSAISDLPALIVAYRETLALIATTGQAPLMLDAFRLILTTLFPFPVFLLCCLWWHTGRLRSKRSRIMPRTSYRNCTTSLHTSTLKLSRETSNSSTSEQARMRVPPSPPHNHTHNTLPPMPCNPTTLFSLSYHPPLALVSALAIIVIAITMAG
jgi:hypothetical protein